jgi:hypothetical protein
VHWPDSDGTLRGGYRIACRPAGRGAQWIGEPKLLLRGSQHFSAEDVARLGIDVEALVGDDCFIVESFDSDGNRTLLRPDGNLAGSDAVRAIHRLAAEGRNK